MVGRDESGETKVNPDDWFSGTDSASFDAPGEPAAGRVGGAPEPTWLEHVGEPQQPAAARPLAGRRLVVVAVALLLIVVAVAVAFVAFGGGGGASAPTVAATTNRTTTTAPAATVPAPPATAPAVISLPAGIVKPGAPVAEVKAVQRALARTGHSPGPIDGDYGPKTVQAVSDVQRSARIAADGIYGPQTKKALQQQIKSG